MNYDKSPNTQPSTQNSISEAIQQISQKLVSGFPADERIEILREVQRSLLTKLQIELDESNEIRDKHQRNLEEFGKAFGFEQPKTANKY